ncbi:MAG: hypothetical protein JXB32_25515 [Deltaproteobacteria bacterium]|nr:hypothetical protein [Deltaproteobacteria bacterium]
MVALVAVAVVVGCSARRDEREISAPASSPAGDVATTSDLGASLGGAVDAGVGVEAAPIDEAEAAAASGPTYVLAADGERLAVRGPAGAPAILELHGEAMLDGVAWTSGPLAWRRAEAAFVAEASSDVAGWRVAVETDPRRPVLRLRVAVRYAAATVVEREALVLGVAGVSAPEALDRDFVSRPVEVGTPHLTDPWTPLEVRAVTPAGPLTVLRRDGFPSAVSEATGDRLRVRLELDDAGDHPFRPYAECHERYSADHARETLDGTPRRAGEAVEHSAELWFGDTAPLRAGRFPEGRRAAIVLTSHADQAAEARTRAVLWGHSDRDAEAYGRRGLLGHGLSATLTAFVERGVRDDLADADYAEVLVEAAAAGVEVGPHSVTAGPDDRAAVELLLTAFDRFAPATWIDHQPDTNCEAVMSGPALPGRGSPYELVGALRAHGYRYVWTEPDVEPPDGGLNLFGPRRPERRPAVLFRNLHYRDGEWAPWMFRTAWLFVDRESFVERLAPVALERLAAERGVLLAHVYLEAYEPRGRRANRSLVEPDGAGFRVRDAVDAAFAALGAAQASGSLWVPSLRSLGDHWTGAAEVRVVPRPDGTVVLRGGTRDVTAMSWSVPLAGASILVDGAAPDGVRVEDGGTTFWLDLPAGGERVVASTSGGGPVRLYPAGRTVAE